MLKARPHSLNARITMEIVAGGKFLFNNSTRHPKVLGYTGREGGREGGRERKVLVGEERGEKGQRLKKRE